MAENREALGKGIKGRGEVRMWFGLEVGNKRPEEEKTRGPAWLWLWPAGKWRQRLSPPLLHHCTAAPQHHQLVAAGTHPTPAYINTYLRHSGNSGRTLHGTAVSQRSQRLPSVVSGTEAGLLPSFFFAFVLLSASNGRSNQLPGLLPVVPVLVRQRRGFWCHITTPRCARCHTNAPQPGPPVAAARLPSRPPTTARATDGQVPVPAPRYVNSVTAPQPHLAKQSHAVIPAARVDMPRFGSSRSHDACRRSCCYMDPCSRGGLKQVLLRHEMENSYPASWVRYGYSLLIEVFDRIKQLD